MTDATEGHLPERNALVDELTRTFIIYQHRLESPMPLVTETPKDLQSRYYNDPTFRRSVESLVWGVMGVVEKHLTFKPKETK